MAWTLGVLCLYRLPRRFPGIEQPYRTRPRWAPAVGAAVALLVIGYALWPGTDLSILWPQEYLILAAWLVLGTVLYVASPRADEERARRVLLGGYYDVTFGRDDEVPARR